jgi:hypothetical protein
MGPRTKVLILGACAIALGVALNVAFPALYSKPSRRVVSSHFYFTNLNNIRNLGLAINNYAARNGGRLPEDIVDDTGRKLWSWRVQILPDVEQQDLYDQLRLDEPWDSEHNLQYSKTPLDVFRTHPSQGPEHHTSYLAPVGPQTIFGEQRGAHTFDELTFRDGSDQTIMLVKVDSSSTRPWAAPGDLEIDPLAPGRGIDPHEGFGFLVCFADCVTTRIDEQLDPETLMTLFQVNDGKALDLDQLQPIDRMDEWRWPGVLGIGLIGLGVMLGIGAVMFPWKATPTAVPE